MSYFAGRAHFGGLPGVVEVEIPVSTRLMRRPRTIIEEIRISRKMLISLKTNFLLLISDISAHDVGEKLTCIAIALREIDIFEMIRTKLGWHESVAEH